MAHVSVRILHPEPPRDAGPLVRLLAAARRSNAERHARGFRAAGATDVEIVSGPADDTPFGRRLRAVVASIDGGPSEGDRRGRWGLVVLGSGAIPLAKAVDRRDLVAAAASARRRALANNRYSADVVSIARADELPEVPYLATDNALPRWLGERAGWRVDDLPGRRRLAIDLDSPLDLELVRAGSLPDAEGRVIRERRAAAASIMADPRAELVVAGRSSAATLRWLETRTAARVRAIIEERGLRAAEPIPPAAGDRPDASRGNDPPTPGPAQRRPRSVLAMVLEVEGPSSLGAVLAQLGDAAVVDTRVLLADRCGPDERGWPQAEDRYASDLLLAERIADPWLKALTAAARDATIPILLGAHTLVGPGIRLLARPRHGQSADSPGR